MDRRTKPVYLTRRGHEAIAASWVAVTAQEQDIERRLGSDRYHALREMVGMLGDLGIDPSTWREPPGADRD